MKPPPSISVDLSSSEAVFRQIANQIRRSIVEGPLVPGDELPGVRRLSIDLGIHFNTVAEAYRQLAADGWIEVSHGRSARVCKRDKQTAEPETVARMSGRLGALLADMRAAGIPLKRIRRELELALEDLKK
ncbi:MAG: GntR family transcriptional regulator [Acidobacteriota bacterium]